MSLTSSSSTPRVRYRKLRLALGAVALLLGLFVLRTLISGGVFRSIEPHGPACERIEGVVGAEDLTVRRDQGWAYVSSFDRWAHRRGEAVTGQIFRLSVATGTVTPLQHDLQRPFAPHGLSLFVDPAGDETLMVVNHGAGHSVEIFDVRGPRLEHRRTVTDPLLISPNDVHASGRETFFATNDHHYGAGAWRTFEDYAQLAIGTVVAFDGQAMSVAFEGTAYANGVQGSLDGRTLYVGESSGKKLRIFDREGVRLTLRETLDLDTGLDNIEIDELGRLWIAAHPKLLAFVAHAGDPEARAPTQVLRLTPEAGGMKVEEVYLSDGDPLSAGATAAISEDRMIIGPVFESFLLSCPRP